MSEPIEVSLVTRFAKNAVQQRMAIGYAVVCEKRNSKGEFEPYFDDDRDFPEHITPQCMVEAACDFAMSDRISGVMHKSADGSMPNDPEEVEPRGVVVHTFPLTQEIADALEITVQKTGMIVAVRPNDESVLEDIRSGKYAAFSIGGLREEGYFDGSKRKIRYVKADS